MRTEFAYFNARSCGGGKKTRRQQKETNDGARFRMTENYSKKHRQIRHDHSRSFQRRADQNNVTTTNKAALSSILLYPFFDFVLHTYA